MDTQFSRTRITGSLLPRAAYLKSSFPHRAEIAWPSTPITIMDEAVSSRQARAKSNHSSQDPKRWPQSTSGHLRAGAANGMGYEVVITVTLFVWYELTISALVVLDRGLWRTEMCEENGGDPVPGLCWRRQARRSDLEISGAFRPWRCGAAAAPSSLFTFSSCCSLACPQWWPRCPWANILSVVSYRRLIGSRAERSGGWQAASALLQASSYYLITR